MPKLQPHINRIEIETILQIDRILHEVSKKLLPKITCQTATRTTNHPQQKSYKNPAKVTDSKNFTSARN